MTVVGSKWRDFCADMILKHNTDSYLVFTDEDFRSIIDVGIGSKGQDLSKIGKFGKGALTM